VTKSWNKQAISNPCETNPTTPLNFWASWAELQLLQAALVVLISSMATRVYYYNQAAISPWLVSWQLVSTRGLVNIGAHSPVAHHKHDKQIHRIFHRTWPCREPIHTHTCTSSKNWCFFSRKRRRVVLHYIKIELMLWHHCNTTRPKSAYRPAPTLVGTRIHT
jgi:hypothetical protein